jgi:hypothetical protein
MRPLGSIRIYAVATHEEVHGIASLIPVLCAHSPFEGVTARSQPPVQLDFQGSVVVRYGGSKPTWLAQPKPRRTSLVSGEA